MIVNKVHFDLLNILAIADLGSNFSLTTIKTFDFVSKEVAFHLFETGILRKWTHTKLNVPANQYAYVHDYIENNQAQVSQY